MAIDAHVDLYLDTVGLANGEQNEKAPQWTISSVLVIADIFT